MSDAVYYFLNKYTSEASNSLGIYFDFVTPDSYEAASTFNGTDQCLSISSNSSLQMGSTDFTISAWVFPKSSNGFFIGKQSSSGGTTTEYALFINNVRQIDFAVSNSAGSTVAQAISAAQVQLNKWYHIVGVYKKSSGLQLYINGSLRATSAVVTGNTLSGYNQLTIGASTPSSGFGNVNMSSIGLWKRALTDNEISDLYNQGRKFIYRNVSDSLKVNLISWWDLNETSGNRLDKHTSNNHLINNNLVGTTFVPIVSQNNTNTNLYPSGYPSGIITGQGSSFWLQSSGSGYLGESGSIKIQTTGDINLSYGTYSLIYQKQSVSGNTLISTIEKVTGQSGVFYKGFEFGVSSNNYLYFEYYNNSGIKTLFSDKNLADKASVFLSIDNSLVTFGNYDFYKQKINSISYPIETNYLFNPSGLYIGKNYDYVSGYTYNIGSNLFVNKFAFFLKPLYNIELVYLNSGYAHDYFGASNIINYINITGITGYSTGLVPYYTSTTGQSVTPTGVITDAFGLRYSGYAVNNLTQTLSGSGVTAITGIIETIAITGTTNEMAVLNSGYIASFGMSSINMLNNIQGNDLVDIYVPDQYFPYNYFNNNILKYDYVNKSFYSEYIRQNAINSNYISFVNGLAQNSGNFYITGTVYNQTIEIQNDYFIDSKTNEIDFSNIFDSSDNVCLDIVTGNYNTSYYIENFTYNTGSGFLKIDFPNNYHIFYDGQKLVSGTDTQIGGAAQYGITGSGIYVKYIDIFKSPSGQLFALPRNFNINKTGTTNYYKFPQTFYQGYSEVYLNGVRQDINNQYIELAAIDINSGKGIFDIKKDEFYNNNNI